MFMQYRGSGVGHKSTCEATYCLLDDHDPLDKVPFTRESEKDGTAQNSDDEMMEDSGSEEEDEDKSDDQLSDDGDEQEGEEEATEVADGSGIPFPAEQLIDDEIVDEMDEFGYTGLDQVLWDDEEEEDEDQPGGYEETLGAEDGEEGVSNEGEEVGFADL